MPTDAITAQLGIPKPDPANNVDYDFTRLILSMEMIDGFIHALQTALAGVALSNHTHVIDDVDGLQAALNALAGSIAAVSDTFEGLSDTEVGDASQGMVLQYLNDKWTSVAAKASFFAIDPIDGINSPSVQGALGELQADIDALLENAPPEFDTLKELADELTSAGGRIVEATPPGSVSYFARSSPPTGWLKANGAVLTSAAYPELDTAIYCGDVLNDTAGWGYRCTNPADATNTRDIAGDYIVLPDLRGEFLRASDDGRGIDAGRSFGSAQGDAVRDIFGSWDIRSFGGISMIIDTQGAAYRNGVSVSGYNAIDGTSGGTGLQRFGFRASDQVPTAAENRPRNIALLACIKY